MFGRWRFISIRMGHSDVVGIIIRSIASNLPLDVVMMEERSILVKLKGFWGERGGSVEAQKIGSGGIGSVAC